MIIGNPAGVPIGYLQEKKPYRYTNLLNLQLDQLSGFPVVGHVLFFS
jgi:hypothetical protein